MLLPMLRIKLNIAVPSFLSEGSSVENATGRDGDANATEGFEVEDASAAPPDDPDTLNQGDAIGAAGHTGSATPDEAADA
ncbi:MAG: hypothetical protein LOD94_09690, partial [Gammaproteobacteria bacterium]